MDAYQVLGLGPSASLAEAEDAYRRLLRIHHPDLHQHDGPDALAAAELRTRALNAAIRQCAPGRRAGRRRHPDQRRRANAGARPGTAYGDAGVRTAPPAGGPTRSGPADDQPLVACPLCGEWFATAPSLKAHAALHHELRFDRRHRGSGAATGSRRCPWVLVPGDLAVSLTAARATDSLGAPRPDHRLGVRPVDGPVVPCGS